MSILEIVLLIVAVILIIVLAFLIPLIIELKKTALNLNQFITKTDLEIQPTIRELNETLRDIRTLTSGVAGKVEDLEDFMDAVGETGRNISGINRVAGKVANVASKSSILVTGLKVTGSYLGNHLLNRLTKRGEK